MIINEDTSEGVGQTTPLPYQLKINTGGTPLEDISPLLCIGAQVRLHSSCHGNGAYVPVMLNNFKCSYISYNLLVNTYILQCNFVHDF